ncbi:chitin disaccharide deacetylase [soil metagenome]
MPRQLIITADDFGIGPETSRGILELAVRGTITSTVLLVNSPFAEEGVRQWNQRGRPLELGWHPCLTLDSPLTNDVPSLVGPDGRFQSLGSLLKKIVLKRIVASELKTELRAQYQRFRDLVGHEPRNINGHHHVHIFEPVAAVLATILSEQVHTPYVRRVIESKRTLLKVKGARIKRLVLSRFGKRVTKDFPGNDTLLGITDPPFVHDEQFFLRWLSHARGECLELTCHPGHLDATLVGRDGSLADGQLHRRAAEFARLSNPVFLECLKAQGFQIVSAEKLTLGTRAMVA